MRHSTIIGTGSYVPSNEVPNDVLRERFKTIAPTFVDKLEARANIKTRWYADEGQSTSDLVIPAAEQALKNAGITAEDLDLIIVGTDSPDHITPATSVIVQRKLGAMNAGTFDVGCACASFPTGLSAAAGIIATNPSITNVLVVGAYMMRKLADPQDPMIFFYGDGAGAAVLQASDEPGFLGATYKADGNMADAWKIQAGGTVEPVNHDAIDQGRIHVRLLDKYPSSINEEGWPALVHDLAKNLNFSIQDIDMTIFTQVRRNTIENVMNTLEIPMEKTHMIMDKWGYTGSACIPMALHDAVESGKLNLGDLLVMVGSGVGFNQAAVAIRVTEALLS